MFSSSNIKSKVIIMKKQIFSLGLMLAAAFTLTNCVKEEANFQQPESEGTPFEIVASTVATKTVNNELATEWVAGDAINLFHAVTDATTYTNDGEFSIAEADLEAGKFKGTLNGTLDAQEEYDWYAFYPYVSQITTPVNTTSYVTVGAKTNSTQTQNGNNSMAHIAGENYPLAGVAYATPANSTPSIKMAHVTSLLEVVVTNNTDEPLTVEEVMVNAPELLVGTYYIKFNGEITPASFTSSGESYTSTTAKLAVTNGEAIAKGASASFYLAVKPFVAAAGSKIEIYVNGAVKELTLGADVTFAAGHVKTLNYSYEATEVAGPETLTVAEFLAKDVNAAVWYQLTGVIKNLANTTYGNFDLVDETGSVYVYGLTQDKQSSNNQSFSKLGLKEGDVLTLMGTRAAFNNTAQIGGPAYYVSHVVSCTAPTISCSDNLVTILAEEGATVYYTTNDDEPTTSSFVYDEPFEIEETVNVKAIAVANGKAQSVASVQMCVYSDPNGSGPVSGTVLFSEDFAGLTSWSTTTVSTLKVSDLTWTSAGGTMYAQKGCVKFGKSSAASNVGVKLPKIATITEATNVRLTFKAVSSDSGYTLTVKGTNCTVGTLSPSAITKNSTAINSGADTATALQSAFDNSKEFSVDITGMSSSSEITIVASGSAKRWYLDDVKIVVL